MARLLIANRNVMDQHNSRSQQNGFTLLELLVVIAILGVLVSIVAPRFFGQISKSEVQAVRTQIDSLEKAVDAYRLDMGSLPSTADGLNALIQRPTNAKQWRGPYLKRALPADPWGNAYVYRVPGKKSDYEILSYGKDGQPGGDGDNADISNETL